MSRLVLDEIVDPFGATVSVARNEDGSVREARFDLTGLPRVDGLLAGQPVAEVPRLVERLCGICPAAHHLAGVRALEALAAVGTLPPAAIAIRRLLHHGSALESHAPRLLAADRAGALALRRFGKAAMAAAGSPGHFPATAVPGGVRVPVLPADVEAVAAQADHALAVALRAAERELGTERPGQCRRGGAVPPHQAAYTGANVALVDDAGRPDLLGTRLLAIAADGAVVASAPSQQWDATVAEEFPGATTPRPHLRRLGPGEGRYRVGPTAQLWVGARATPLAAEFQREWLAGSGDAASARAIMTVHAVEVVASLLDDPVLLGDDLRVEAGDYPPNTVGVGWVDGPRGLLVHRYATGADGRLASAQILTPTVQNECWLAELLTAAAVADDTERVMEAAIREADPCLPCNSAPAGAMGLQISEASGGY